MVTAVNSVGLDVMATAQPSGLALSGEQIVFSAGTTPFQSTDTGTIALYGYKITFSPVGSAPGAKASPFVQYGRTSGSYQLQIRLQVDMDIPGSEVQYASIRYATNGVDIQGMPDSSPLVTSVNSLGTNTSFADAQDIGNVLDTSNNEISVSGQLNGQDDVNWYKFELSYTDIQDLAQTDSFPLSISVNYADGLGRPDTVLWVFDSAGDLIYEANNSEIVDNQNYLGNDVTDPNATSYGPDDPTLGPVQFPESDTATYYVAITGIGMTADVLQSDLLARQEPIDSINRVVEDHIGSTDGSGIADQVTQSIDLTPNQFTLADVTMYTNTGDNLDTVSPLTGGYETDVTGGANTHLPLTGNGTTYGDIAMRPDGELFGMTDSTNSATNAGQLLQFDTGDAANETFTPGSDNILSYQLNAAGTGLDEQTGVGFNVNAMAFTPEVGGNNGNFPLFVIGDQGTFGDTYNNTFPTVTPPAPAPPLLVDNLLYKIDPATGAAYPYPGTTGTDPQLGSNIVPLAQFTTATGGQTIGDITGMAWLNGQMYCIDTAGNVYTFENLATGQDTLDTGQLGNAKGDYGLVPATYTPPGQGQTPVDYIASVTGGPAITLIGTISAAAVGANFEGLTAGPPDIVDPATGEAGEYANTLFAVDSAGNLYTINIATTATTVTATASPMLSGGSTSVQMIGPGGAALNGVYGVAFSNVDYNLWHETTNMKNTTGHGITTAPDDSRTSTNNYPVAGGDSFYFGIENPSNNTAVEGGVDGQVDSGPDSVANYKYQNATIYGSYDGPGGAHGSLESTAPFSLAGYTAQDMPTLSFTYYEDATPVANGYDTTRVFISDDGATGTSWIP